MPDVSVHNETEYALTTSILDQIKGEALEYFGEYVRAIRVQYGIERHAFNARTGEMRYAFSPGDFGLVDTTMAFPDARVPSIDDDAEDDIDVTDYDDVDDVDDVDEVDIDEKHGTETSLESLSEAEEVEETEEQIGFRGLDNAFDDIEDEDDDKDLLYDDEYDAH
jgi:hypothetical protein